MSCKGFLSINSVLGDGAQVVGDDAPTDPASIPSSPWSDIFELMPQVDACLLGGAMYPGHEQYWTAAQNNEPDKPLPLTGRP
jgi:hypothetical protein